MRNVATRIMAVLLLTVLGQALPAPAANPPDLHISGTVKVLTISTYSATSSSRADSVDFWLYQQGPEEYKCKNIKDGIQAAVFDIGAYAGYSAIIRSSDPFNVKVGTGPCGTTEALQKPVVIWGTTNSTGMVRQTIPSGSKFLTLEYAPPRIENIDGASYRLDIIRL